eukprot:scaffold2214_cov139-Cylindrotheca_fusiformis.AAC.31
MIRLHKVLEGLGNNSRYSRRFNGWTGTENFFLKGKLDTTPKQGFNHFNDRKVHRRLTLRAMGDNCCRGISLRGRSYLLNQLSCSLHAFSFGMLWSFCSRPVHGAGYDRVSGMPLEVQKIHKRRHCYQLIERFSANWYRDDKNHLGNKINQ